MLNDAIMAMGFDDLTRFKRSLVVDDVRVHGQRDLGCDGPQIIESFSTLKMLTIHRYFPFRML
jgi:hypothetical protein